MPPRHPNVTVVCHEPLAEAMGGPGIRAVELARQLADHASVRLLVPLGSDPKLSPVPTTMVDFRDLGRVESLLAKAHVVVAQVLPAPLIPRLKRHRLKLVFDLYDPTVLEQFEGAKGTPAAERAWLQQFETDGTALRLAAADHILCASSTQRDFYTAALVMLDLITPAQYDADPALDGLISIVPLGIPSERPAQRKVLKGVWPGIARDDKVVIWGGGMWNWLDPLTAVRAIERVARRHPTAKLWFMGAQRPPMGQTAEPVVESGTATQARQYAKRRGLEGRSVFFNEDWVPYHQRGGYLRDADVGLSLHCQTLETRFSFRTRILDYLWAELPIVTTEGDVLAEQISDRGVGYALPEGDVAGVTAALERTLYDPAVRRRLKAAAARTRGDYTWTRAAAPLVEYCRTAADQPARTGLEPTVKRLAALQHRRDLKLLYRQRGPWSVVVKAAKKPFKTITRR